jgi:4-amino-4-deoxy-L-arabinose transferase-like glycosyltransferase
VSARSALLFLLSLLLYQSALGSAPIHRAQEARVAEVAREMRESGKWLVPELNARLRLQKPPLPYWAVAASYGFIGRVDERSARLPSALCAIAAVLLTAFLAGRLFGPRAGLLAGACLATTRIFLQQGRRAEADVPLALFVILAMVGFELGWREDRRTARWIFFAAMGVAFMTKGVPGVAIPLLAALVWLSWEKRGRAVLRPSFLGGLALTILIAAPWYVTVWRLHPDATAVFRAETIGRMTQEAPHAEPLYFYLYRLPVDLFPWILLLPTAWLALRRDPEAREAARLPAAWALGGLGFLTALHGKQPHYLVPIAPAFAILLGGGLDRALAAKRPRWLTPMSVGGVIWLTSAAAIVFFTTVEPRAFAGRSPRDACRQVSARVGKAPLVFYKFSDSACVFYLGRTAEVAADDTELARFLQEHPDAYVLARQDDGAEGMPEALRRSDRVQWVIGNKHRRWTLLGPGRPLPASSSLP